MNEAHLQFLASPDWAKWLDAELLPWLVSLELGDDLLEVGPGPGLTTDLLRQHAAHVTAVELDDDLAAALAERMAGTNVDVVHGDATSTGLPADRFSAAACFAMLHHIPSAELQDRVFAEMHRVLRPTGIFVGTDSVDSDAIRDFHVDDVFVPMPPDELGARLDAVGFRDVDVHVGDFELRFRAAKPAAG
jgi:SAM-dependent methyltransferase